MMLLVSRVKGICNEDEETKGEYKYERKLGWIIKTLIVQYNNNNNG